MSNSLLFWSLNKCKYDVYINICDNVLEVLLMVFVLPHRCYIYPRMDSSYHVRTDVTARKDIF